ncbi:S8 family serine peptidase [Agromyces bauzanensis]|uniref:Peptidase S8/S53 domain-containing protein n=1 Tax=Agromyces bauzanensis TaxID=1308924 RepID=A0A917PS37_9MICO|nr:S8 family serine peptidase [Agromyces bauzanensis]GGJ89107.1 hypothetical protein GCM10011372_29650 [Agromyces bauzanensis]
MIAAVLSLGGAAPATATDSAAPLDLAGFEGLADEGHDGAGVVVAIVDTGLDLEHPAFEGRVVDGWDFVDDDDVPQDGNGHGTHVAGTVAAAIDWGTPSGAPAAAIMPVRVLDDNGAGSPELVARGILWAADHGAQVINLSLGDSGALDRVRRSGPIGLALREAAATAVVVVAAGNDGQYEQVFRAGVPGLVVVAVDGFGEAAPFTNIGDDRAVAAPGVEILSTAPSYPTTLFPEGTDGSAVLSGTSMAAPFVAAVAALLVQAGLSPAEIRDAIPATAANPAGDPRLGAGIVNARAALATAPPAAPTLMSSAEEAVDAAVTEPYLFVLIAVLVVFVVVLVVALAVAIRRV